jgi:hypothetical protein
MGWSLNHQQPREPELIDAYLLALGKAVYLASNFEHKCRWILRLIKLGTRWESDGDVDTFMEFAHALKDRVLGPTLVEIRAFENLSDAEVSILEKGKDGRNFIAHEAGALGLLSLISSQQLSRSIEKLREQLEAVISADNMVSRWVYEIEEKEPAPKSIQREYPEWVREWVFADWDET